MDWSHTPIECLFSSLSCVQIWGKHCNYWADLIVSSSCPSSVCWCTLKPPRIIADVATANMYKRRIFLWVAVGEGRPQAKLMKLIPHTAFLFAGILTLFQDSRTCFSSFFYSLLPISFF